MRRIVIVCLLLCGMLLVSGFSMYRVDQVKREMDHYIDTILDASRQGDSIAMSQGLEELSEYWKVEERKLIHFVRHSHIDEITRAIAKLSSLAEIEDNAELRAELLSIKWQMESIWYSELPVWDNIL